jgi:hypothetical protein
MNYRGAYASGTTYQRGDTVTSAGATYVSLITNNIGNTPASSPTDWGAVGSAAYTLPTATSSILGGVKPDGTTISNTAGAIAVANPYNPASVAITGGTITMPTGSSIDVIETGTGLYGVNNANGFFQTNLPNDGSTATVINKTVCENSSGNAQMCGANAKSHVVGACTAGCGSTGYPKVAVRGNIATMTFDATAAVVAGDWVVTSATAGLVADSGSSTYPTCGNQVVGVATTSGLASTTESVLIRPDALLACLTGIRQANNTAADSAATSAQVQTAIGAGVYDPSGAAAARQANLSLLPGTYTNGDMCTYVSSGTLLNCNTAIPAGVPSLTSGSVLYSNGSTIAQDNSNFFWDATNHRLGIGTTSPGVRLQVVSSSYDATPTLGAAGGVFALASATNLYGLYFGVSNTGSTWIQSQRNDGNTAVYNILLQPSGGNVGIGTMSPSSKLTVNGAVSNGVTTATASDNRGTITLVAGTGTYTFTQGPGAAGIWTTAPICVINDDTSLANIATSTKTVTATSLTIAGSVGTTDTYSYVCWAGN